MRLGGGAMETAVGLGLGTGGPVPIWSSPRMRKAIDLASRLPGSLARRVCGVHPRDVATAPTPAALVRKVGVERALPRLRATVRQIEAQDRGKRGEAMTAVRRHERAQFGNVDWGETAPGVALAKTGIASAADKAGALPGGNAGGSFDPGVAVTPAAGTGPKPSTGWPAAPPFRPGNWDFAASKYSLAFGDTLSGLAHLYLGAPQRWKEIHAVNPGTNPDKMAANKPINMPLEARDRAQKMLGDPAAVAAAAPSTIGKKAPVAVSGEDPNAPTVAGGTAAGIMAKVRQHAIPLAIGGALLVGGGVYAATR